MRSSPLRDAIHIHLSWPISRDGRVGSRGRRDAVHGTPQVRVPDVHGYRQSRAVTRSRVGGFGSARADAHRVMIAVISHRFDGHVQLHARRRGHRLGARCCVRGVMVCVEIRFHGDGVEVDDGFNYAQDSLAGRGAPSVSRPRPRSKRRASSLKM